jgi:hypothetical protein
MWWLINNLSNRYGRNQDFWSSYSIEQKVLKDFAEGNFKYKCLIIHLFRPKQGQLQKMQLYICCIHCLVDKKTNQNAIQKFLLRLLLQMHFCCLEKIHTFLIFGINVSGKLQQSHDNLTISAEGSMMQRNEPDEIVQNKCKRWSKWGVSTCWAPALSSWQVKLSGKRQIEMYNKVEHIGVPCLL